MTRTRSKSLDYLTYLAVRLLVCLIQALTWRAALVLAHGLAWLGYRFDRRHRLVAAENIRGAFPHFDDAAVQQMVRDSYNHLLIMIVEMIRMPRLIHPGNWSDWLRYTVPGHYEQAMQIAYCGRPVLILTGHFGNWEVLSYACGAAGFTANLIARRLDNPYLDRFLNHFRRKTGQRILDKNKDYDRILDVLKSNGRVAIVGDQDAGPRGLFVPFLGRPASTFKSIALLSLQFNAPIIVITAGRIGLPMVYELRVEDVIDPEQYASHPDPVRGITMRYSQALERAVWRHPEQYFWVHRRWKHRPPVQSRQAA